ncbi:hypothetical protein KPH14_001473 [Odynerus spinipes]|uniref:Peptidase S1 domain-containing protein n=1 Tax=Odynerus spinipes TaxID=1348599 RepID=A0AAD9RUK7_9HYME|nr:hypothetical protein KPH14_001473 [Odynerus spinipes]
MFSKEILLFLFLGTLVTKSFSKRNDNRSRSWTEDSKDVFLSSKHVDLAERAIENFLTKLTGPISSPIALRQSSNEKEGLEQTICEVSHVVRRNLMDFAKACGLTSTVRRYERNSNIYEKSNDWLSEVLLRGSLLLHDLGGIMEEVSSSVNRHFRQYNLTLLENEVSDKKKNPRFLGTIDDFSEFCAQLYECSRSKIQRSPMIHIFAQALANMARESPKHTLRDLGSRLDDALANGSSNGSPIGHLHIFFCNLASNNTGHSDYACVEEFERFRECLSIPKYSLTKMSKSELDNRKNFWRNRWLSGIGDLSNCVAEYDEDGNANVKCKTSRRMPKNPARRIKYIYESLLGQKLSRRSPLHRAANDLGNVISMTPWGRQLTEEMYHYLSIYQDGVKKMNRLSRLQKKDKNSTAKYKQVSRSLRLYKKGLLLKTLDSIDRIHRTTIEFEKIVVSGIKTAMNENWQSHLRILSCVSDWMSKLLLLYDYEEEEESETITTTARPPLSTESKELTYELSDDSDNIQEDALIPSKKVLKEAADKSFEKLIRSMNRVSVRTAYEKSTLVNLANNLLLTAMFMETIGFVSALFSLGSSNKEEIHSSEGKDDWSARRKRRSLTFENPRNDSEAIEKEDFSYQIEILREVVLMIENNNDYKNLATPLERISLHDEFDNFQCGASILSRRWGITALHCLNSMDEINYYVRAGSNYTDEDGTLHKVTEIHAYDETAYQYGSSKMFLHDIALFKVTPPFRSSSTIRPIRLPQDDKRPRRLYVSGWGYTSLNSNSHNTLMTVNVPYVPFKACVNSVPFYKLFVRRDRHLCYGRRGKDSCYGDSGGPLADAHTIYGIVSFGHNCAEVSGVYVKISYYREWIKIITKL